MCGIFAYLSNENIEDDRLKKLEEFAHRSQHRGPDASKTQLVLNNTGMLVFHRLCIVDTSDRGMQPFYMEKTTLFVMEKYITTMI